MNFIVLSYFICGVLLNVEGSQRIIGGTETSSDFGRFHVSLQNGARRHVCGGTIISHRHIATAAHCVFNVKAKYIKAIVGTTNLDNGGLQYDIKSIHIHNKYNRSLRLNDIAILQIKGLFDLDKVQILRLDDTELEENENVLLSGFGAEEPHGESVRVMHALNVTVFSQQVCQFAMRYTRKVYDSMFCTFTRIGEGSCHGDSGGPLTKDNKLVGIVSWGIPCAVGFPDVHTRISAYVVWIRSIIDRHVCSYCRPKSLKNIINLKFYNKLNN